MDAFKWILLIETRDWCSTQILSHPLAPVNATILFFLSAFFVPRLDLLQLHHCDFFVHLSFPLPSPCHSEDQLCVTKVFIRHSFRFWFNAMWIDRACLFHLHLHFFLRKETEVDESNFPSVLFRMDGERFKHTCLYFIRHFTTVDLNLSRRSHSYIA